MQKHTFQSEHSVKTYLVGYLHLTHMDYNILLLDVCRCRTRTFHLCAAGEEKK